VYRSCGELQDGERVVYYSVFFDNDVYKGTRQSLIMEACEAQQFTPVDQSPPPATPKSPPKRKAGLRHSRFVYRACGKRGADLRPDFNSARQPGAMMGNC